ncbi:MAG TPA: PEP-CTERM sorting domain-containing protein [Methylotenera sp.]|nr:PEP-CTERM sorting domain-containing protein [Methylotenera sp.]
MKFQLKALAAALVLAAVAVPAQAAIDATASGNGSLILTVLDKVANVSAAFDLGKNYLDFNQVAAAGAVSSVTASGTSFSWDLGGNVDYSSAWNSFLSAANLANVTYAITAGDNLGSGAGSRGYITTYVGAGASTTTSQLLTALGNFDTYTNNLAVVAGSNTNTVANGAAVQTPATIYYGSNKNNGTGVIAAGAIGTSLGVVQTAAAASNLTAVSNTVFGNGAKFTLASNGALSYTTNAVVTPPVPEADTWAMMLLGLGFMGFVARRRKV